MRPDKASARKALLRIVVDGLPPNGIAPEECGAYAGEIEALYEEYDRGGAAAVLTLFDVLAKTREGLRDLIERGRLNLTDLGNAERLVKDHGERIRYCAHWKQWLIWDDKRWAKDDSQEIERLAKRTVRSLQHEAADIEDAGKKQALFKWGIKSEGAARINAMIALARSEAGVAVVPKQLDQAPYLLTVQNGTVDLRTGEIKPHDQADLITKLAPVAYRPDAPRERWLRFLNDVFAGDADLIAYIQRAAGYSATADTREQVVLFLYGTGANGKSVLLNILAFVLGSYAQSIRPELLMTKRSSGGASEGEAALANARFVRASETGAGQVLDDPTVKRLTGGGDEAIRARFLHSNEFEFMPTHKIWVATNHKPTVKNDDHGIWRRIHLVPFNVRFEGERLDPRMEAKLKEEAEGILAWLVDGAVEWYRTGLRAPAAVLNATASYRAEMDTIAGFLEECCVIEEAKGRGLHDIALPRSKASDLYAHYRTWASSTGETILTKRAFGGKLRERGFETRDSNSIRWYLGIGIRRDQQGDSDYKVTTEAPF
ncbi:MAG: phage/plasmid primase, P4 family [Rhodothermales bacterium]|nr:phage/plasmid primase, P4 family [Rhodothermales bacterium]